jgi:cytochrome P450
MTLYDPFSPEAMRDPHPLYRELRASCPIYPLPQYDGFALARFEDVWAVIGDAERVSVAEGPVFAREGVSKPCDVAALGGGGSARSFSTWDPPLHTRIRQAISAHFRPRALARLEGEVRALARDRLEAIASSGSFDVVRDYASPIAGAVICRVLGLPGDEAAAWVALVNRSSRREPGRPGMTRDGIAAQVDLHARVLDRVREQSAAEEGHSGVLGALRAAELDGRRLGPLEIATQLLTLLVGAVETLPKIFAGGLRELAREPDQRADLALDPGLAAGAFEEMIRHQGVLQHVGRTALCPLELRGQEIRRGQRLFLLLQSANRDEREFEAPDAFRIRRRAPRHLGLGHGPHHCVGAHLARLEGRVLLEELVRRIPEYEVDEAGAERLPSEFQLGWSALPIRFAPSVATSGPTRAAIGSSWPRSKP